MFKRAVKICTFLIQQILNMVFFYITSLNSNYNYGQKSNYNFATIIENTPYIPKISVKRKKIFKRDNSLYYIMDIEC